MKQLVMVGLVGLVCACGGRGGNGSGPPQDERDISIGKWQFGGKTFYSVHDSPSGGFIVLEQPAHVWRCSLEGKGCTTIDTCPVTTPGPTGPTNGSSTTGSSSTAIGVACPQICDCMGNDCRYYCGANIVLEHNVEHHLPPELTAPTAP